MDNCEILSKDKSEFKIIFQFADGRTAKIEEFCAEKDLTEQQNSKITAAFCDVLSNDSTNFVRNF